MTVALRGVRHESDVLIRQLDERLARLRAGGAFGADLAAAEAVAAQLRALIPATNLACAADRARVRVAVHYFLGRPGRDRRFRPLAENLRLVTEILADLTDTKR